MLLARSHDTFRRENISEFKKANVQLKSRLVEMDAISSEFYHESAKFANLDIYGECFA